MIHYGGGRAPFGFFFRKTGSRDIGSSVRGRRPLSLSSRQPSSSRNSISSSVFWSAQASSLVVSHRLFVGSSAPLRPILRNDKIKVPYDERLGVVYQITYGCKTSYIGEAGNFLLHRYNQHLDGISRYNNARRKANETQESAEVPQAQDESVPAIIPQRRGGGRRRNPSRP
ncbi:hypothetical protein M513_08667 [Trichuris suis]|uniref:GIY-YIG domain-containing protein n=1 Tax=Trichuris suis TaxID=68888 RepID=A0A085LZP4_9BILA|nr:hypothetical protein M513_08667 [Trichuris suis]